MPAFPVAPVPTSAVMPVVSTVSDSAPPSSGAIALSPATAPETLYISARTTALALPVDFGYLSPVAIAPASGTAPVNLYVSAQSTVLALAADCTYDLYLLPQVLPLPFAPVQFALQ